MLFPLLTASLLAIPVPQVAVPQTGELTLEVAMHTYGNDDRRIASAGDSSASPDRPLAGYVWSSDSLCSAAGGGVEPKAVPAVGWRFSGRIVQRLGDEFFVEVDWQRIWDQSMRSPTGPNGVVQVTLRAGDRLELDRVVPGSAGSCGASSGRLEVAVVLRTMPVGAPGGGVGGGGRATAVGGGSGGSVRVAGPGGPSPGTPGPVSTWEAEMWLVHRMPDGVEDVQRQTVIFGVAQTAFTFSSIPAGSGLDSITIGGSLRVIPISGGSRIFEVAIQRQIKADGKPDVLGKSSRRMVVPSPADVTSYELPAPPNMPGHQFSVRVRVTPRP